MRLEKLHGLISERLIQALVSVGIENLNPIQIAALRPILNGKNAVIIAPTGSGKTEAAMIPIIERMLRYGGRALYITPLRALNRDMHRRLIELGKRVGFSVDVRHGDTPRSIRKRQARKFPDIMITTPETFQLLFLGKNLRQFLFDIRYVIVDELHELIDNDRGLQLVIGLERLEKYSPRFQRIGLSATISKPEMAIQFLCGKRPAEIIDFRLIENNTLKKEYNVRLYIIQKDQSDNSENAHEKLILERIRSLLGKYKSVLIFTNTRQEAELLGSYAMSSSEDLVVHHGSLSKDVRESIELSLRFGKAKGVICTSSLELGIDIGHVEYVVQVDSPRQVIRLVQRVGRSGHRLSEVSKGEIIARDFREALEGLSIIDLLKRGFLEDHTVRNNGLLPLFNQIIAYGLENNGLFDKKYFYEIIRGAYPYRDLPIELLNRCLDLALTLGYLKRKNESEYVITRRGRRYFYENISMIPDERKYSVYDIGLKKTIGTLDEEFVVGLNEGDVIILAGIPWQVIEKNDEKALLKVSKDIIISKAFLPKWVGENIPVSMEVCQRVLKYLEGCENTPMDNIIKENAKLKFLKELEEVRSELKNIPHKPGDIIIEYVPPGSHSAPYPILVMYTFLGHKANAALSIIFATALKLSGIMLSDVSHNAYGVYAFLPLNYTFDYIKNYVLRVLPTIDFSRIRESILANIKNLWSFQRVFMRVARKLGIKVEKQSRLEWLLKKSTNSSSPYYVIMLEALSKFFTEKADLNTAKEFWESVVFNNTEKLVLTKGPTKLFYTFFFKDLATPRYYGMTDDISLQLFKSHIEQRTLYLVCLNKRCGYVEEITPLEAANSNKSLSTCPVCGSSRGISKTRVSIWTIPVKQLKDLEESSRLLSEFGYKALLAMATIGVNVKTAKNILSKYGYSEYLLIKGLRKAYMNYIRTRYFWKH